jgi:hypothetical protein
MAYGTIKVDTITFTDGGVDKSVAISGLVQNPTFTGNVTVTGTISGNTVRGQTISGVTVTGTTAQFTSGTFVSLTGTTLQGTTATYTTGSFTSLTGTTTSGTTANFVSGVFSTQISGVTVTGTTANFTSGNFTNISGGTHTITSGVFALGTAANPSISFISDPNSGLYSPGADQVAISTNGTGRLFVDASGNVGVATSPSAWSAFTVLQIQKGSIASSGDDLNLMANAYYDGSDYRRIGTQGVARQYFNTDGSFIWSRAGTGTANSTVTFSEVMRLDSSGRLGLGTSSPNYQLHVTTDFAVGASGFNQQLTFSNDTIQSLLLGTGYTALKLNPLGGNVGIGVASPGQLITAQSSASGTAPTFKLQNPVDSNSSQGAANNLSAGELLFGATGAYPLTAKIESVYDSDASFGRSASLRFSGANGSGTLSERMRIDASGNVGIGTQTPSEKLSVAGSIGIDWASGRRIGMLYDNSIRQGLAFDDSNRQLKIFSTANDSGGTIAFFTRLAAGSSDTDYGTERARIDSSGRLLVGTSSEAGNAKVIIRGYTGLDSGAGTLNIGVNSTRPTSADTPLGYIRFTSTSETVNNYHYASISAFSDGASSSDTDIPGRLVFSTTADGASSPTERMRIDNAGNVGINATPSTSYRLLAKTSSAIESALGTQGVTGDTATQSILVTKFDNDTTTAQNFIQFQVNNGGANCGRITANGANTAAFGSTSDIRLKENIEDLPPQLENILGLRPVEFDYIESEGGGHQIGFIAQEMQQIYPDVVNERGEDDMLMITGWSKTEARLVKALQEAVAKIETLEAKVAALEGV